MEISKSVLEWREGDLITSEHRDALAANMARAFNLSPEKEAETRAEVEGFPDAAVGEFLAVLIAQELRMNVATFRQNFPTIARCGKTMSLQNYLETGDELAGYPPDNQPDLGQIG